MRHLPANFTLSTAKSRCRLAAPISSTQWWRSWGLSARSRCRWTSFGTKSVITGDVTQIDLARGQKSGLIEADRILTGVRGIAFTRFTSADVVRHPLIQKIIGAYERDIESRKGGGT